MSAATSFYSAAAASLQSSSADCGSSSGIGSSLAAFSILLSLLFPPRDLRSPTQREVSALQVLLYAADKKTQTGVCLRRRRGGLVAAAAGIGELDAEAEVNGNPWTESQ